jgi:N-acetylglucosamine kinase-like BadF-type ATPase
MFQTMQTGVGQALQRARLTIEQVTAAGFGVAGYDWHSEKVDMLATIGKLGLKAPVALVNDTILGLVAGAEEGWGVAVVSGTGCNCRGWDRQHRREGRVTGYGVQMGEAAGATELVFRTMQLVSYAWTRRGPATALSDMLIQHVGATGLEDLIEGYTQDRYHIGPGVAPLIFQVAEQGDAVARGLIHWAGCELGEMANGVIRQLEFERLAFDVVLAGSMFEGGAADEPCAPPSRYHKPPGAFERPAGGGRAADRDGRRRAGAYAGHSPGGHPELASATAGRSLMMDARCHLKNKGEALWACAARPQHPASLLLRRSNDRARNLNHPRLG